MVVAVLPLWGLHRSVCPLSPLRPSLHTYAALEPVHHSPPLHPPIPPMHYLVMAILYVTSQVETAITLYMLHYDEHYALNMQLCHMQMLIKMSVISAAVECCCRFYAIFISMCTSDSCLAIVQTKQ